MLSLARTWVQFLVGELRSHKPHGEVKIESLEQVPGVLQSEQDIAHSPPDMGPLSRIQKLGARGTKNFLFECNCSYQRQLCAAGIFSRRHQNPAELFLSLHLLHQLS